MKKIFNYALISFLSINALASDYQIKVTDNGLVKTTSYIDTNGWEFHDESIFKTPVMGLKIEKVDLSKIPLGVPDVLAKKLHTIQIIEGQNSWPLEQNRNTIQYPFWQFNSSYQTMIINGNRKIYAISVSGKYEAWFTYFNYKNSVGIIHYVVEIVCHNDSCIAAYITPEKYEDYEISIGAGYDQLPLYKYYFTKSGGKWISTIANDLEEYRKTPKIITKFISKLNAGITNLSLNITDGVYKNVVYRPLEYGSSIMIEVSPETAKMMDKQANLEAAWGIRHGRQ
jgi:hypothetical protein